jgi:oxygen-dependent protoporphyrinogen oxidase
MSAEVIVVGGGSAGLSAAWRLHNQGIEVLLLEAEGTPGGNVQTEVVDGFRLERGPHTFLASADDIFALADEVGIEEELAASRPAAANRFIVRGEKIHRVPSGPGSFLKTRLLSSRGKLDLLTEPFRTKRGDPSETAAQFFERRFGKEGARVLAGAFISGVYAGDPEALSAPAAFPLFWGFEQESGGMIRGALKLMRERKAQRKARGETAPRRKGLYSCRLGLGQLSSSVAAALDGRCHTGEKVVSLSRDGDCFRVETSRGEHRAPQVIIAVPPAEAARLTGALDPGMEPLIGSIPMAPVAVVHMGFRQRVGEVPEGFGFLAPRKEGIRTLGVLFPSRLFDGRTPNGGDLLTGYVGGMLDQEVVDRTDEELLAIVTGDLDRLLGLKAKPSMIRVARYPHAIPQLVLGHLERIAEIRDRLRAIPGLHLAGNYLRGVGIKDAVASDFEAAEETRKMHHERRC